MPRPFDRRRGGSLPARSPPIERPRGVSSSTLRSRSDPLPAVNNAGARRDGLLAALPGEAWDEMLDANLGGVLRCCRGVIPRMMPRRAGSIVNVSSLTAVHGLAGQTAYDAAKAGILGLTRSWRGGSARAGSGSTP